VNASVTDLTSELTMKNWLFFSRCRRSKSCYS